MGNVLPFSQNPESRQQPNPDVTELLSIRDHVMTAGLASAAEVARLVLPELSPQAVQPEPVEQPNHQYYQFPPQSEEYPDARAA